MKIIITLVIMFTVYFTVYSQINIKWEQTFNDTLIPPDWGVVDNDNSGYGLTLFQAITLPGASVLPQAGQSFWASNYQNANLTGVIDEWLISPQISVIYSGDSLYFWAGAIGGLFNDSLRVWISTTDGQLSSFTNLIGYFRVDGPAGSWHKYGFDLSPFDSCDIYFAINYYIRDGGSGGQNSDFVWIDHFIVTGDPSTINIPPTDFYLINPPHASFIHPEADSTIHFKWGVSSDGDGDTLRYTLKILDIFPQLTFSNILDTSFTLNWNGRLNSYSAYRWTVIVTDGKSTIASPDTFLFITPPVDNLAPFPFTLVNPPEGDTLAMTDTLHFLWHRAIDPNSDTLMYTLNITCNSLDTNFTEISDTSFNLYGETIFNEGHTYQWRVMVSDRQYTTYSLENWSFVISAGVGLVENISHLPLQPLLSQNFPNPANPTTTIELNIPRASKVTLKIYTVLGEEVTTLVSKQLPVGSYSYEWDGSGVASGIYLYRLETEGYVETRKMVVMK